MESTRVFNTRFFALALMIATCAASAGCHRFSPAAQCAAPDTLATVQTIVADIVLGDNQMADRVLARQALADVYKVELVRFSDHELKTGKVSCAGKLQDSTGSGVSITYTIERDVGDGGKVIGVELPENGAGVFQMVMRTAARYRELENGQAAGSHRPEFSEASSPPLSTPSVPSEFTRPRRVGDVSGFPLGHRNAPGVLTKLEDVNGSSALMVGRVTRESARHFCVGNNETPTEIETCIADHLKDNSDDHIASANCQTGDLLASNGVPYRRVRGGWRDMRSNELIETDAPPASGILVIEGQFEVLCPIASARPQ